MRIIAHVVNLAAFPETSQLYRAQAVTIRTMEAARDFVAADVKVSLLSVHFLEDEAVVPESFIKTRCLDRSVLDTALFQFPRRLPLIKDILDRAFEALEADYIVYTNVDIGALPYFYHGVNRLIDLGYDSFIINRRTITDLHTRLEDIPLMYAEAGRLHMGYDCFVFERKAYEKFDLGDMCIGAPLVGKALMVNQIVHSRNFNVFRNLHLTFHLGNDKRWVDNRFKDYKNHNLREYNTILSNLSAKRRSSVKARLFDEKIKGIKNKIANFFIHE